MIKNLSLLLLGGLSLSLMDAPLLGHKKKEKPVEGKYAIHFPYFSVYRQFIENMLHDHTALCATAASGFLAATLYKKELHAFTEEHKPFILGAGIASIVGMYFFKDRLLPHVTVSENEIDALLSDMEGLNKFAKSNVRIYYSGDITTRFKDVAGLESAKAELQDILDFLKNPVLFKKMGATVPKGVLLNGSPGNGKTLLARALAGEAGCPFLYITATEFVEAIVGVGAARMRNLFAIARDFAPCIIFIDEIDAIGHKRTGGSFAGDTELTQTLNQLLAEMDGFEQHEEPIIIIGATNRMEILDEALLRPGRFDRKVKIHSPYVKDRYKILQLHFKKIKISKDIDLEKIAVATKGFSGAELAQLANESAILAIRDRATAVTMSHVHEAYDSILLGKKTVGMDISLDEYYNTAIHESGHAIARVYQKYAYPLYKVTIDPRGGALGLTFGIEEKESYSVTDVQMRAEIIVMLSGSVAEEMFLGHRAAGASNDLEHARALATEMVMRFGMTQEFKDVSFSEFIHSQVHLPNEIATKLHYAVAKIIQECRVEAEMMLTQHKDMLLQLAQKLMDERTVSGSAVYQMCGIQEPNLVYSLS
ncbi:AAA family ATPase [Candidatus Babeliales bacterium]|nr:AAA family ATPase [Candidatus Babeliales bacterium]